MILICYWSCCEFISNYYLKVNLCISNLRVFKLTWPWSMRHGAFNDHYLPVLCMTGIKSKHYCVSLKSFTLDTTQRYLELPSPLHMYAHFPVRGSLSGLHPQTRLTVVRLKIHCMMKKITRERMHAHRHLLAAVYTFLCNDCRSLSMPNVICSSDLTVWNCKKSIHSWDEPA